MLPKLMQYWFDYYWRAYPPQTVHSGPGGLQRPGADTFAQCCGAYMNQHILPQGMSLTVNTTPIEQMTPDNSEHKGFKAYYNSHIGYEVKETSVPIDGGRFINLRWIEKLPNREEPLYQLNANKWALERAYCEYPTAGSPDVVSIYMDGLHHLWKSNVWSSPIYADPVYTATPEETEEMWKLFEEKLRGKYVLVIFNHKEPAYVARHKPFTDRFKDKVIFESPFFNNRNHNKKEDYLALTIYNFKE